MYSVYVIDNFIVQCITYIFISYSLTLLLKSIFKCLSLPYLGVLQSNIKCTIIFKVKFINTLEFITFVFKLVSYIDNKYFNKIIPYGDFRF